MVIIFRMNISRFTDRCGLRLLIFLVCYMITGLNSPSAPLHIITATAAALAAAGVLDSLLFKDLSAVGVKPKLSPAMLVKSMLRRENAKRFITAAIILGALSVLLPFAVWYVVSACCCAVIAVICLAAKN